jgi:hypothetical protein
MRRLTSLRRLVGLVPAVGFWCAVVPASANAQAVTAAPASSSAPLPVAPPAPLRSEIDRLRTEVEQLRTEYEQRLRTLEEKLGRLEAGVPDSVVRARLERSTGLSIGTVQVPPTQPPPDPAPAQQPAPAMSSKVFNPDISVIGNFVGVAGKNDFSDQPSLELTEVEAAFQAIVDPYARADFYLAASPEGVEVEEGYITFTSLPKNLLLKVGKMRAQFGKVNTLHTHTMPTADRPLVTGNLVGGEEGLSDAGLSLSYLVPNPSLFIEATGEVYRGESEVFQTPERSKLAYVGRVRAFRDLTEGTNLEIGTSFAFGPTNAGLDLPVEEGLAVDGVLNKRLFGIDATFRYRPLQRAIYRRLNLRTELIWSRQELPADLHATAFGFYGLGEYQFARRWYLGARLDRSARVFDSSLVDKGGSVFLTFWPTEFSQVRGQYRRTNYAEGIRGNEFLFQFNFSIGAHGAHVF